MCKQTGLGLTFFVTVTTLLLILDLVIYCKRCVCIHNEVPQAISKYRHKWKYSCFGKSDIHFIILFQKTNGRFLEKYKIYKKFNMQRIFLKKESYIKETVCCPVPYMRRVWHRLLWRYIRRFAVWTVTVCISQNVNHLCVLRLQSRLTVYVFRFSVSDPVSNCMAALPTLHPLKGLYYKRSCKPIENNCAWEQFLHFQVKLTPA